MSKKPGTDTLSTLAKSYITLAGDLGQKPHFGQLAEANKMGLADLREHVVEEYELLDAFAKWLDGELARHAVIDPSMPKRERVLDVMMERFELLKPYKAGMEVLLPIYKKDVSLALKLNCLAKRSMGWVLTLSQQSPRGLLRDGLKQGLVVAYLNTLPTFFADDTEDLSKTMAKFDKELRRGEKGLEKVSKLMSYIPGLGGKKHHSKDEAEAA